MMIKPTSTIEDICEAAVVEKKILKGQYKVGISENMLITPFSTRYVVSLLDEPVSFETFKSGDPNVRATRGIYGIKYMPKNHRNRVKGKPYFIAQDLLNMKVSVSGPYHFKYLCNSIPELAWLRRNSHFADELFYVAKDHPGLMISFSLDAPRYARMIKEKAKAQGLDIDNHPLVAYQCSCKDYESVYCKKQLSDLKTKGDYIKELSAAESVAVQEYKED